MEIAIHKTKEYLEINWKFTTVLIDTKIFNIKFIINQKSV
jgi:hypothetical protein